jgi:hypothetical protein
MKPSKHIKTLIGFAGVIFSTIFIGCAMVNVPLSNYNPAFTGDYSAYKGKRVYLMNFDNQANDTTIWSYSSLDKKFSYSNNNMINNYFWYAFEKSFTKLGMLVSRMDNPDLTAPAMWVTLLSITDVNYRVRVTVQERGITVFTGEYTVQEPPIAEKERNPAVLEERAYKMTNKLVSTILEDSAFQKHLTGS